jgi:hypothetical protein
MRLGNAETSVELVLVLLVSFGSLTTSVNEDNHLSYSLSNVKGMSRVDIDLLILITYR